MELSPLTTALLEPLLDPASRTWWASLATGALVAALFGLLARPGWTARGVWRLLWHRSTGLDVQLYLARQLTGLLWGGAGVGAGWLLATHSVRWLDRTLGVPALPELPGLAVAVLYSVALFVVWDASRWITHWLMHRVPALWAFHQVHHSASVLTPLTFHRLHPLESLVYQLRGVVSTGVVTAAFFWAFRAEAVGVTLLGVPAAGLVLNALFGNLRHSHVWLRFPAPVERWLISPAQHQLHHSAAPAHCDANYGTWLAAWDRLAGTLQLAPAHPPEHFGIPPEERNHGDDLLSAWLGPFLDLLGGARRPAVLLAALLLPAAARAQDEIPLQVEDGEEEYGTTMLVVGEDGTPRVAGSAHKVEEETLEQFEFNNIERVLNQSVPGVNTRNEDGFGLRPNIGIRGANSDRSAKITLMEDGVLLAPAPYAAPAAYYFPMSTRLTGVEVFKGPAATRYGPHTVGGAINLLTRPVPEALTYQLDGTAGLWRTVRVHGYVGAGEAGRGFVAEGVRLRSDGFKTLDTGGSTGFDRSELMLKGRWAVNQKHRLELKLGYANETSNETYLGLSAADYDADPYRRYAASSEGLMQWDRTQAELAWPVRVSDHLHVRTVAYHHWMGRAWTKFNGFADGTDAHDLLQLADPAGQSAVYLGILRGEEDSATDDQNLIIGTNDRRFHSFGVQSQARWRQYGETWSSTLTGGVRLHGDIVDRLHTEAPMAMRQGQLASIGADTETTLDSHATARALAAHLHEDLRLGGLHLLPGARLEVVQTARADVGDDPSGPQVRTAVLPGLGIMQELGPWASAFAGAHRGFSPVAPGQPEEVNPELSWNYEAGARVNQGDTNAELVGFVIDYTNLTGQCTLSGGCVGDGLDQQFNGGEVWVYGAEAVAGHAVLLPGDFSLPAEVTYTWTESRFRTGFASSFPQFGTVEVGDSLPYVPQHQGSARLTLKHPRFRLGVSATARGGMLNEAGAWPVTDTDVPGLVLLDAAGDVQLTDRWQAYVTGTNLTGEDAVTSWRPVGARPTPPLQVMVGLRLRAPQG